MDSGLIFPIIVALWLVFLVPHWVRRREHLSSSRAADRFSSAIRLLERRDEPAEAPADREPSYLLTPPRKHLDGHADESVQDLDVQSRTVGRVDRTPTRQLAPSLMPAPRPTPPRDLAVLQSRKVSPLPGLLFLAALASIPVLGVLAVLSLAPVWSPAAGVALTALCVVWLRRRALRRRALRAARPRMVPQPAAPPQPPAVVADVAVDVPDTDALLASDTDDGTHDRTWTPVPVPPPTYTLKPPAPVRRVVAWEGEPVSGPLHAAPDAAAAGTAAAPHPASAPAAAAEAPAVRRVVPDLELVLERRRAAGE